MRKIKFDVVPNFDTKTDLWCKDLQQKVNVMPGVAGFVAPDSSSTQEISDGLTC